MAKIFIPTPTNIPKYAHNPTCKVYPLLKNKCAEKLSKNKNETKVDIAEN